MIYAPRHKLTINNSREFIDGQTLDQLKRNLSVREACDQSPSVHQGSEVSTASAV